MNNLNETLKAVRSKLDYLTNSVEQTQRDNDTLTESIQKLEKEQKEGYKTFNTDTHVLVKKDRLENILEALNDAYCSADSGVDEIRSIDTYYIEEAERNTEQARDEIQTAVDAVEGLLG